MVISDFQLGTVDRLTVDRVPESVGVRFRQTTPAAPSLAEPGADQRARAGSRARGSGRGLARRRSESAAPDRGAHRRAVAIYTRGVRPPEELEDLARPGWQRLLRDSRTRALARSTSDRCWSFDTPASSFELPRAIRSIRRALLAPTASGARTRAATVRHARRLVASGSTDGGVDGENADRDDSRWFWLAALAFIGLERGSGAAWMRGRRRYRPGRPSVRPDATREQDAGAVRELLDRGSRRLQIARVLRATAWGPLSPFCSRGRSVERGAKPPPRSSVATGRFKNVLITADEILAARLVVPDYVAARVMSDAAAASADVDLRTAIPLRRAAATAIISMLVWGLLVVLLLRWPGSPSSEDSIPERRASNTETGAWHVNVTIVPPAYSGRPRVTVVDPDRVEALEGSALHLRVDQVAPPLRARTSKSTRPLTRRTTVFRQRSSR